MDMNAVYKRLDEMFQSGQSAQAEDFLIECLQQAQTEGDFNSLIMLLNEMIGYCRETGQKEKSLAYSSQVIQLMQQLGMTDSVAYGTTLLNVANACRAAGKLDEAYQFYMEVFPIYEKHLQPDDFYYAGLYNNMSLLFQEMEDYEKSVECLEKALRIVRHTPGAEFEVAVTHTNISSSLCKLSEKTAREEEALRAGGTQLYYEKSRELAAQALEEAKEAVETFRGMEVMDVHMAAACTAYADALSLLGDFEEAQEYYILAMSMIENAVGRTEAYRRVGEKLAYVKALQSGENVAGANEACNPAPGYAIRKDGDSIPDENVVSDENIIPDEKNTAVDREKEHMSGLALAKAYFEAYGKKMLFDRFPEYLTQIAVGLCGEGSDCLGYDDAYSADHDFGPGFAMWVDDEVYEKIGRQLQEAYDSLPRQFMGYERIDTPQGQGRCGVCTYRQYLQRILGIDHVPQTDQEWLYVDEEALRAAVSGEIFTDPSGNFTAIREALRAYYPESVRCLKLAQEMTLFSQNGQYNYERMLRRGDKATANLLLVKAAENAMKLLYLLDKTYAPHTKWLLRGIEDMGQPSMMEDLITSLLYEIGGGDDAVAAKLRQIEKIAAFLLEKMKEQEFLPAEATDTYLAHYAQLVAYGGGDSRRTECGKVETVQHMVSDEEKTQVRAVSHETKEKDREEEMKDCENALTEEREYTKEEMVDAIVRMEWKAFDQVKNEGGRAGCQDDWTTFQIMRKSQYLTWNEEMLGQYIYDFSQNMEKGWNPITEKYARMMESTAPQEYEHLKDNLPEISAQKKQIMEQIIEIQVGWMEDFAKAYPKVASGARVIHTSEDGPYETSYETYLRGEIGTYSDDMLMLYGRFIAGLARDGKNLARMTMENTVHMYGYDSLGSAEEKMW